MRKTWLNRASWAVTVIALILLIATTATHTLTPILCAAWTLWGVSFGLSISTALIAWSKHQ